MENAEAETNNLFYTNINKQWMLESEKERKFSGGLHTKQNCEFLLFAGDFRQMAIIIMILCWCEGWSGGGIEIGGRGRGI